MTIIKVLSLILLAIYLIFTGLVGLMGFQLHWIASFLLGLSAVASGVLILLSIHEYYNSPEK